MTKTKTIADPKRTRLQHIGLLGTGVLVLGAIIAYIYLNDPSHKLQQAATASGPKVEKKFDTPAKTVDPKDAWITKSEAEMEKINDRIKKLEAENEILKKRELNSPARKSNPVSLLPPIPSKDLDTAPFSQTNMHEAELPPQSLSAPTAPTKNKTETTDKKLSFAPSIETPLLSEEPEVESVTFKKPTKKDAKSHIRDTIPANSYFKTVLLSGLDAPTGGLAQSNPHPVLLELIDKGSLPNKFKHAADKCRVSGAGYGNISDERAYIRLERFTCVLKTGEIISKQVKGYIAGPDGKNGIRGHVETKQGAMIARAMLAGMFGSLGSAVSNTYTSVATSAQGSVQTIDPSKTVEYGLGAGVGNALEKISDWYLKRADEVYPVIEIPGGLVVQLVFTEDVDLGANLLEGNL